MTKLLPFMTTLAALVGSCNYGISDIASVPDNPTFNRDVYPLFADHCLVCHGAHPDRGAPAYFRLDIYADAPSASGAKNMASSAISDIESARMPPAARSGDAVGPNGLQMLKNWVKNGRPE
jgi:hypothetical protein